MKTNIVSLSLTLLFFLISCGTTEDPGLNALTVLVDVSSAEFADDLFVQRNMHKFFQILDIDPENGSKAGAILRLSLISGVSDDKFVSNSLDKGKPGQNKILRKDELDTFYTECSYQFQNFMEQVSYGRSETKIYNKLCREVAELKRTNADKMMLILFSDMLENSNLCRFYGSGKDTIQAMINDPVGTLEKFSKDINGPKLPEGLDDIDIMVVTHRTDQNDEDVLLAERFWTALIASKGGKIRFSSAL